MGWLDRLRGESRAVAPAGPSLASNFLQLIGVGPQSAAGVTITVDSALSVPAVSCAVNFIAETVASLPRDYFRRARGGERAEGSGPIVALLKDAATPELTAYEWTKGLIVAKLTGGRGLSYIERDEAGRVINLWPLNPDATTVKADGWSKVYEYREGGRVIRYRADEIIDLPFMLKADGVCHRGPLSLGRDAIGLAIAAVQYGSRFYNGGGVPPFAIEGNFTTPAGMQRAVDDLAVAVRKAAAENRLALALPSGHTIKQLGTTPEDAQFVELQRFLIEEIARLYQLPPVFLQDLSHGTYSNTEQQDLHLVKHTLMHHVRQFEQELNLKLFGRANRNHYVEFNVDGIQRGDFKTRIEGWARGIQTGVFTPNEARRAENLPDAPGGDSLFMQGATVPIGMAGAETGIDPNAGATGAEGTQA